MTEYVKQQHNLSFVIHTGVGVYTDVKVLKHAEQLFYSSLREQLLRGKTKGLSYIIAAVRTLGFIDRIIYGQNGRQLQFTQHSESFSSQEKVKTVQIGAFDSEGFIKSICLPISNNEVEKSIDSVMLALIQEKIDGFMPNICILQSSQTRIYQEYINTQNDVQCYLERLNQNAVSGIKNGQQLQNSYNQFYDTIGIIVQSNQYKCTIAMTRGNDITRISPAVIPGAGLRLNACVSGDGDAYQTSMCLEERTEETITHIMKKSHKISKRHKQVLNRIHLYQNMLFKCYRVLKKHHNLWTKIEMMDSSVNVISCQLGISLLVSRCDNFLDSQYKSIAFDVKSSGQYMIVYK